MSARANDIIVFGATGFTGQHVARELVESGFKGTFALAGRNRERLELVAAEIGVPNAPILVADVSDYESLVAMARAGRVVISTVGPFRHWGEAVVRACVEASTDYLDVCGEPEFIEKMELDYGGKARDAGCYIASAVGFDSVPGDVGAFWTSTLFIPPARCTLVETFISLKGGDAGIRGHYPTFESAVHGFAAAEELAALRRRRAAGGRVDLNIPGPKPRRQGGPRYEPRVSAWVLPFMGSDASVVRRTAAALAAEGKAAYHCNVSLTLPSRFALWMFLLFGGIFSFLAKKSWGRRLLLAYPRIFSFGMFSHEGPSPQQLAETRFEMINFASGYSTGSPSEPNQAPDMVIKTRVAGPEPGYVACSRFIVAAAATLVEERDQLGVPPGAHTPAHLLQNTTYVDRLRKRGIVFEQLE